MEAVGKFSSSFPRSKYSLVSVVDTRWKKEKEFIYKSKSPEVNMILLLNG